MDHFNWVGQVLSFDERRDLVIPGNREQTIEFCANQWIQVAADALKAHGRFTVALSGGSTPNAIYKMLSEAPYREKVDWSKVFLFWSDERSVAPDHSDSNYGVARKSGFGSLPIPQENIFRMKADPDGDIEVAAREYEKAIWNHVPDGHFDLVMLGMGDDGHTASLFPRTHALHTDVGRIAVANYVPQLKTWRMTLTYECINAAKNICIYVLGKSKADIVSKALLGDYDPDNIPIQRVGTPSHKALWIMDQEASVLLNRYFH